MAERPIYLDHFASTPIDPRVLDAMLPYLKDRYGHPGSRSHVYGWEAEQALEAARARVADLVHADPAEIVFTSGGTEADNLAVKGVAEAYASRGRHVVTSAVEARPVLDATQALADRAGGMVTRVPVDARGRLDEAAFAAALRPDTVLACVTAADAEVGTIQPIAACGAACANAGVLLHVEAAYASPWVSLDVRSDGVHLLSLSAHRLGGPKGAGALYVRRREPRVRLVPLLHGGGHERGLRPGAPDVAAVVGFGVAAELARVEREARSRRVAALRDRFEATIRARLAGVTAHGDPQRPPRERLEPRVRRRRGRGAPDGHAHRRGLLGRRLHERDPRALPRPARAGRPRPRRPPDRPILPGLSDHRPRDRPGDRRRPRRRRPRPVARRAAPRPPPLTTVRRRAGRCRRGPSWRTPGRTG